MTSDGNQFQSLTPVHTSIHIANASTMTAEGEGQVQLLLLLYLITLMEPKAMKRQLTYIHGTPPAPGP